jgi:hypothetical protein
MSSLKVVNTQTCPRDLENISNKSLSLKVRNTSLACSSFNSFLSSSVYLLHNYTIAVGASRNGNWLSYSTDNGVNWNSINDTSTFDYASSIAYNGKIYVAVGGRGGNSIAYSYDLKTWNGLGITIYRFGKDIKWTGKRFISVGNNGIGVNPTFAYSENGKTNWISLDLSPYLDNANSIEFKDDNNIVIAGQTSNHKSAIIYSTDGGKIWTKSNSTSITTLNIYFDGINYWAGSNDGTSTFIEYSLDGINWNQITNDPISTTPGYVRDIYSDSNILLAVGITTGSNDNKSVEYSSDQGKTWGLVLYSSSFQKGEGNSITKNNKYYVAGGDDRNGNTNFIIYSSDGKEWQKANDKGILANVSKIFWTGNNH